MMAVWPEPTDPGEYVDPEGEDCIFPKDVLAYVRNEAARRDPPLAHHYQAMPAGRIKDGIDIALQILEVHRELMLRQGRRARTGKRRHAQRISALLNATNSANLVVAEAYLESALGVLPPSGSHHGD